MASDRRLRISIRSEGNLVLQFTAGDLVPLEIQTDVSEISLAEFRDKVAGGLNELRRWTVGRDAEVPLGRACDALRRFIKVQGGFSSQLFRPDDRYRIREFFLGAVPAWRTAATPSYLPPVVQIVSRVGHLLPLEFLPLFDASPPNSTDNTIAALAEMSARFPAFSSIVHHSLLECLESAEPVELPNLERLQIRFFQHARTTTARLGYLALRAFDDVNVIGPWPSQPVPRPQFITDLAEQLWHGGYILGAATGDHIQYFACHCDTQPKRSDDYSLLLAHDQGWLRWGTETAVTLGELHQEFGSLPRRRMKGPLPLVFLNACGGSRMTPTGVTSFPHFFLRNANCAVIATETPVQDDFAQAFAHQFYATLLKVKNCGQALFGAKWALLKEKHNPQGILYSIYGNPDVHLRRARSPSSIASAVGAHASQY